MGKTYIDNVKYTIHARFEIDGIVEKPDIVGAIFGQTEGLLGADMDLKELQNSGRIGRIEVHLKVENGKTSGKIIVPSALDMVKTSTLAAAIESIDRVGPCDVKIEIEEIEDTRKLKRQQLIGRAKELLESMLKKAPDSKEISESLRREIKSSEVVSYGREKLPAGPEVDKSSELIIVEGRADVISLLRSGIKNVIAVGGARGKIPRTLINLSNNREVTAFLDGDRGGDIILKELVHGGVKINWIVRAPRGKEVEELTQKEILKLLHKKSKFEKRTERRGKMQERRPRKRINLKRVDKETQEKLLKKLRELEGSLKAVLMDKDGKKIEELPIREIMQKLTEKKSVHTIVLDGIVTQRLLDLAAQKKVQIICGIRVGRIKIKENSPAIITQQPFIY